MDICEAGKKENVFVGAYCELVKSLLALGRIANNRVSPKAMYSENGGHIWTNIFFFLNIKAIYSASLSKYLPPISLTISWFSELVHGSLGYSRSVKGF